MLFRDTPARITSPGTWDFGPGVNATYTVGRDFVQAAMAEIFRRTTDIDADIETFGLGLNSRRLKSVAFGDDVSSVVMDPRDPYQEALIRKTFEHATTIGFYKSTFDVPSLYHNGLLRLDDVRKIVDPLLYARLATPGVQAPKTLEALSDRYLKTGPGGELAKAFKALGLSKKDGFFEFDLDRLIYLQGAASDPLITHRVRSLVRQHAYDVISGGQAIFGRHAVTGDEAWTLVEREQRLNRIFLLRSCKGFRVDMEYLEKYRSANAVELREAEEALLAEGIRRSGTSGKFNAQDLAKLLDARGEIGSDHPRTEKTGAIQMDKEALKLLSSPLAAKFKRHGQISHIAHDYIGKTVELSINGRVHPEVNLLAAVTGRSSYGSPPTHQFSGPARRIIMPDEGDALTGLDLSQGEPITIANMARDVQTVTAYEAGVSVYIQLGIMAGMLPKGCTKAMCDMDSPFGVPALAMAYKRLKIAVLARLYGEGKAKLSADLGLPPGPYEYPTEWEVERMGRDPNVKYPQYAAAVKLQRDVDNAWPKTAAFVEKLKTIAKMHRKIITVSGRVIPIPVGKHGVQAHKGVNYPTQGGQYDVLADIIIRCEDAGLAEAIYLNQHDELVVSTSAAGDIRPIMEAMPERLVFWAGGRRGKLLTDRADMGRCWGGEAA